MATTITRFGRTVLFASLLAAGSAQAAITVLTFDELQDDEVIGAFYNGGTGGLGSGPGPNFGVVFTDNGRAIKSVDTGGSGNFANEPSPSAVMYFLEGESTYMNVLNGFDTGFSFYYSSLFEAEIKVFDGLNGEGNELATLELAANSQDGNCKANLDPDVYCNWDAVGIAFANTAYSIGFGGQFNSVGFDNVTFGSENPGNVAEPNSLALLGLGLLGLVGLAGRRRKAI